jgi:hypothetical protein
MACGYGWMTGNNLFRNGLCLTKFTPFKRLVICTTYEILALSEHYYLLLTHGIMECWNSGTME